MEVYDSLLELEPVIHRLSRGVDAVNLIVMGLCELDDPNANGLYAVWEYLSQTQQELKTLYAASLQACRKPSV